MRRHETSVAEIERSLRLLPWWWVLRWAWLGEAIWVIYLIDTRGLTIGQVLIFDAVFTAAAVVAEVPTGVLADRYGLRRSMLWGSLVTAVAFVAFGLADTIALLLGSYLLFGLGFALMSGADDAYLFNSLRAAGRGAEFSRVAGRLNAVATIAAAGFTMVGGLMVIVTPLSWPIVASGGLSFAAAVFAWRLPEPPRGESDRSFLASGLSAGRRVVGTPSLRWGIVLGSITTVVAMLVFTTFQPIAVDEYGLPVWALGWVAAGIMLASSAGGWSAGAFQRRLGLDRTLRILPLLAAVSLLGGATGLLVFLPVFVLAQFAWNAQRPLLIDFLSRRVPDSERATALSYNTLAEQLATIVATVTLGVLVDQTGLRAALAGSGVVLFLIAVTAYLLWRRAGDREIAPRGEAAGG